MYECFEHRIEEASTKLAGRLDQAKKKPNRSQVERQIGRILGSNSRAAGLFDLKVHEIRRAPAHLSQGGESASGASPRRTNPNASCWPAWLDASGSSRRTEMGGPNQ